MNDDTYIKLSSSARIISGMLLCCEENANQMQDVKTTICNSN